MKNSNLLLSVLVILGTIPFVFAQSETEYEWELTLSDEENIILFAGFIIAVIGIFLFLARDIVLRKKTSYDKEEELESKKDKTYEKYHSDWSDDYEELGTRKNTKEDKEFREAMEDSNLPNYYKILDVPQDATQDEIKNQYRKLAKKLHPDKSKDVESDVMVEINKAYEILSNEELREKYDRYFKSS